MYIEVGSYIGYLIIWYHTANYMAERFKIAIQLCKYSHHDISQIRHLDNIECWLCIILVQDLIFSLVWDLFIQ